MVEYIFRENSIPLSISNHMHSKSASEILVKIVTSPSPTRLQKELLEKQLETKT